MKQLKLMTAAVLTFCLLLSAAGCSAKKPAEVKREVYDYQSHDWVLNEPAKTLDLVLFNSGDSGAGDVSARILQGVINKKQPRVYIAKEWSQHGVNVEAVRQSILRDYGEVDFAELKRDDAKHHQKYSVFWTLFSKYSKEVEKIFVFSDSVELSDTINVAAMFASRYNGVAVNRELADQIIGAGYDLPVIDIVEYCDFTGDKASPFYINEWIGENMADGASKSLVVAAMPSEREEGGEFLPMYYDLAVATNALIYNAAFDYLDEGKRVSTTVLDRFPDNTPVVGWAGMAMEDDYVTTISKCGKLVAGIDWGFGNGSVWAAFPPYIHEETVAPVPDTYEAKEGETYIAFMTSDGDAWHFIDGNFLAFWNTDARGKYPIGWSIGSLLYIYSPLMLEYIYDTRTDLDNLMQGPSGVSYLFPSMTPPDSYTNFLKSTKTVFGKLGINMTNMWDYAGGSVPGNSKVCTDEKLIKEYIDIVQPDALFLGHDSLDGKYSIYKNTVIMEEVGDFKLGGAANPEDIIGAVDTIRAKNTTGKPTFIMVNLTAWGDCVTALEEAITTLQSREDGGQYHFITPAELVAAIKTTEGVTK